MQTVAELKQFLDRHFPQGEGYGELEAAGDGWAQMRLRVDHNHLRPGGTVSGPTMMGIADVAMWIALQTRIGPSPLTVTSHLNINFLSKPKPHDLIAQARILRVGRRSGVGECCIHSGDETRLVAHVTATYAIPGP